MFIDWPDWVFGWLIRMKVVLLFIIFQNLPLFQILNPRKFLIQFLVEL